MNLKKLYLTENACFKEGEKIDVRGIMVHSTGVNNPYIRRYVGPDDGLLGKNAGGNHWNTLYPDGREVCVHAFIGKLSDGTIGTYQTLPWDMKGWHAGGSANGSYIGFEICEDGHVDHSYFNGVYKEALELTAYLCREFGLSEKNVIDHSEGHGLGIASGHSDVGHWFPKFGKSMDTFRKDLSDLLNQEIHGKIILPGDASGSGATNESIEPGIADNKKLYRVQIGAYKDIKNAQIQVKKAVDAGFKDAFIRTEKYK